MEEKKPRVWKYWPNAITLLRLALIPVFILFFYYLGYKIPGHVDLAWDIPAMIVYAVASFTDLLDGWIARKYHLISDSGKLLDPLADKLMLIIVMFTFWLRGMQSGEDILPLWVILVLLSKEVLLVAGGMVLYVKDIVVQSKLLGKFATAFLMTGVGLTFLREYIGIANEIVIYIGLVLTVAAFFQYGIDTLIRIKKTRKQSAS
ncbi:MAG: CDP-alcohol phosphatidyltransferase family protein [Bacillota bacterium]|nr:CDP-alcohol phosphatidyltransferase family protein [Bacillota bacterium]